MAKKDIIKEQLRKNKIFMEQLERTIKVSDVASLKLLKGQVSQEIAKKMRERGNKCKYCGSPTGSPDPDVLCKQCREGFGHTFYSEL